jgi:XTP/dITP diphosphohydrolase
MDAVYCAGMTKLLIATRNAHKVEEIRAILGSGFVCHSLTEFEDAPEVVEDAGTFAGNATKKAVELAKWISARKSPASLAQEGEGNAFVLADDSGLEVDALGGAPGVHSARFAALAGMVGNSTSADNNAKLLRLLQGVPQEKRTGRFRCVLALTPLLRVDTISASPVCSADEFEFGTQLFQGVCEGRIGFELRGSGGFGYDPLFFPSGFNQTFSELSEQQKNELSHRARALALLKCGLGTARAK